MESDGRDVQFTDRSSFYTSSDAAGEVSQEVSAFVPGFEHTTSQAYSEIGRR